MSDDSHRTLPRAVVLSLLTAGVFFLLTSWGILVGWGSDDVKTFVSDDSG